MKVQFERLQRFLILSGVAAGMLSLPLLLLGCNGSATQTTNDEGMQGTLVDTKGEPVAGVEVKAYAVQSLGASNPNASAASMAVTDKNGHYSLIGLESGYFNVFARQSQGYKGVAKTQVHYEALPLDLGVDTLVATGSITGRVLVDGSPESEVFCFIPGSPLAAITGSDGRFTLPNIPAGTFTIKFVGSLLAIRIDSGIVVASDSLTVLENVELSLNSRLAPAKPRGLIVEVIDSQFIALKLGWEKSASKDIKYYEVSTLGYSVNDSTASPILIREQLIDGRALSLIDTLSKAYENFWGPLLGMDSALIEFHITAIDSMGNSSPIAKSPTRIQIIRPEWMLSEVNLRAINLNVDSSSCGDTLSIVADIKNSVADSADYFYFLDSYKNGEVVDDYNSNKHYPIEKGRNGSSDTLSWWMNKGDSNGNISSPIPDSISIRAEIYPTTAWGRFNREERLIIFRRNSQGCLKQVGPVYELHLNDSLGIFVP